jgi:hypothetical protein
VTGSLELVTIVTNALASNLRTRLVALITCLFLSRSVAAVQLTPGDMHVTSAFFCICGFTFGQSEIFDAGGHLKYTNVAWNASGDYLYDPNGTIVWVDTSGVVFYSASLERIGGFPIANLVATGVRSATMDSAGRIYVAANNGEIRIYTRAGELVHTAHVPVVGPGIISADLSVDQCTLNYLVGGQSGIKRYDLCADAVLPELPVQLLTDAPSHVRAATDGSVFVTTPSGIARLQDGRTTLFSPSPGDRIVMDFGLNLNNTSIWQIGAYLSEVDIATNRILRPPTFVNGEVARQPAQLFVFGVPRAAAQVGLAAAQVPAVSPSCLFVLAIALASVAAVRLRT